MMDVNALLMRILVQLQAQANYGNKQSVHLPSSWSGLCVNLGDVNACFSFVSNILPLLNRMFEVEIA